MKGIITKSVANLYRVVELEEEQNNEHSKKTKENHNEDSYVDCTARGKFKNLGTTPVVGDIVEFSKEEKVIENIYERKNYIKRPKMANISQIIFVISMKEPKLDLLLLDKQLALAENLGINSIIVINKCDLAEKEEEDKIAKIYRNIGYKVFKLVAKQGQGINELQKNLEGKMSVFAGNSGVGKSTIINRLFGSNITQEGLISLKNGRGKNTTTIVNLYELENKTFIADSPGFSTFEINEIEKEDLGKEFIEFNDYLRDCRYIGCSHVNENEKECGIKKAVTEGKIAKSRYDNYCKIYNEIKAIRKY